MSPSSSSCPRPDEARRLYEQVCLWSADERSVLHFPESETLPFERLVTDADTEQQRIGVLARLLDHDSTDAGTRPSPNIIIASASAVSQKTVSRESFEKSLHRLVPRPDPRPARAARPVAAHGILLRADRRPAGHGGTARRHPRRLPRRRGVPRPHRPLGRRDRLHPPLRSRHPALHRARGVHRHPARCGDPPRPHAPRSRRLPHALHRHAQLQRRDPRAHRRGDSPPPRRRRGRGRQLLRRVLQPRLGCSTTCRPTPSSSATDRPTSSRRHGRPRNAPTSCARPSSLAASFRTTSPRPTPHGARPSLPSRSSPAAST